MFNPKRIWLFATLALAGLTGSLADSTKSDSNNLCSSTGTDGPMQITPDCIDPMYHDPIITSQADEPSPVQHRKISGYFNGTGIDFNIYLPHQGWDGRFFQLVFPTQNSTATPEEIGFGAESGGYTVHVAGTGGYRSDAAVAKLSRKLAGDFYRDPSRRIYGYIYGGSGGSFKTVGAMENTFSVWDGAVPLIQGIPISDPFGFSVAALGGLVLENKVAQLQDAVRPGGINDTSQFLNAMEQSVFEEVSALGMPPGAWEDFSGTAHNRSKLYEILRTTSVAMKAMDPTYSDDFWSQPGYLGEEQSELGDLFRASLIDFNATVRKVTRGAENVPTDIELDMAVPSKAYIRNWYEFTFQSACDGVEKDSTFTGRMDPNSTSVLLYSDNNSTILKCLEEDVQLRVDNRWFLAMHAFHRHELPTREGYNVLDYLRNKDGTPRYPQRDVLVSHTFAESASGGGKNTGNITAKMIVMDNLLDNKAFPWEADWYRAQVQKALGDRFDSNYRLYYSDNADHDMGPVEKELQYRLVDFTGLFEQHLRDLSAWVEKDIAPPPATNYHIRNGQVEVPESASERAGIQPVAHLSVQKESQVGVLVTLQASVDVPRDVGKIVSVEWDVLGNGNFVQASFGSPDTVVRVNTTHSYTEAGVYFPSIRVASHRSGNTETPYALAYNLGRARVIVQ